MQLGAMQENALSLEFTVFVIAALAAAAPANRAPSGAVASIFRMKFESLAQWPVASRQTAARSH